MDSHSKILTDDPFSGFSVVDQFLTQPVTIDAETIRWKTPSPVNVENEYEVTLFDDAGTAYRMVGVSIAQGHSTKMVGVNSQGLCLRAEHHCIIFKAFRTMLGVAKA